jgi:hypothetical protein
MKADGPIREELCGVSRLRVSLQFCGGCAPSGMGWDGMGWNMDTMEVFAATSEFFKLATVQYLPNNTQDQAPTQLTPPKPVTITCPPPIAILELLHPTPAPFPLQPLTHGRYCIIYAISTHFSGATTECDLIPASSTLFPNTIFSVESPGRACLFVPVRAWLRNFLSRPCLLNPAGEHLASSSSSSSSPTHACAAHHPPDGNL